MPKHNCVLLPVSVFYELSKFFQSKKYACFNCRYRTSRHPCNLLITELLVDSHFEDGLLLRRKMFHQTAKVRALLFVFKMSLDRGIDASREFGDFDKFMGVLFFMINAVVHCDPVEPRFQARFPAERWQVLKGFDENFLRQIHGVITIVDEAITNAVN